MSLQNFGWSRPPDLPGAFAALADGALPYCGGTELVAAMNLGLVQADQLVSLRGIPDLAGIEVVDGQLLLGATTTHRAVSASPVVQEVVPLLAQVTEQVGNIRVRSTGTLGGNLAFAEPRSDVSTVLIAMEASVVVSAGGDPRRLPVADFLLGPYEPDLEPEELLLRIEVPAGGVDRGAYRKVTVTERPVVGAALVRRADAGTWRVVVGAVGDEPLVAELASLEDLDVAAVADEVDVLEDLSGSEAYKRQLTRVVLEQCRQDVLAQGDP